MLLPPCIIAFLPISNAFFSNNVSKKVSPQVMEEAMNIYSSRFSKKGKGTRKRFFFEDWGFPERDIDGTRVRAKNDNTKSFFDIQESQKRAAFSKLVELYGESNALAMIKILPNALGFNYNNFGGALLAFSDIFGEEEAKAMVLRNPGLLAISPSAAATSDDQTMQFSYIVSATRPIGKAGLPLLLALLSIPFLEQITEYPIRAKFF